LSRFAAHLDPALPENVVEATEGRLNSAIVVPLDAAV